MNGRVLLTRRSMLMSIGGYGVMQAVGVHEGGTRRSLVVIEAPSNLGLRPLREGHIPGAWEGPQALREAGLLTALESIGHFKLERPAYQLDAQEGTRIRNGHSIRRFSEQLACEVGTVLRAGQFPVVIGGDCSVLLGSLLGARRSGGRGVVHVDGHSDFFHPGNYDAQARLGSAAGMDLALATGRGEALLTKWPGVEGALVDDEDAIQIGERDFEGPSLPAVYADFLGTGILQVTVQSLHQQGLPETIYQVSARMAQRQLNRAWLHVDLDVLDEKVMPAVDSPGSPGLTYAELAELLRKLLATRRFIGVNVCIYDPELDPKRRYARDIVDCLKVAFSDV